MTDINEVMESIKKSFVYDEVEDVHVGFVYASEFKIIKKHIEELEKQLQQYINFTNNDVESITKQESLLND